MVSLRCALVLVAATQEPLVPVGVDIHRTSSAVIRPSASRLVSLVEQPIWGRTPRSSVPWHVLPEVGAIKFGGAELPAKRPSEVLSDLRPLSKLGEVDRIRGTFTALLDDALVDIARHFPSLQHLDLGATEITDAGLEHVSRLPVLETLAIHDTRITDTGIARLLKADRLRELSAGGTPISRVDFSKNRRLERLYLHGTDIGDQAVESLRGLRRLIELSISDTKVTDNGTAAISEILTLRELDLGNLAVTDEACGHLTKLRWLEVLYVDGTQVTADGVEKLLTIESLQVLDLRQLRDATFTDNRLRELADSKPETLILHERLTTPDSLFGRRMQVGNRRGVRGRRADK